MRKLFLYAHTHWDREWYMSFESFRLQLLSVVRKILRQMDEGALPLFHLDGQSVIFEDLLEIDPSLSSSLEKHMRSGRLSAGPFYVLGDQMLVSGESLVRNLLLGLSVTRRFGNPCPVGYCPDTFGHSQDLPRILSGFQIRSALVWRGVPPLEMGPLFWWRSPDGSRVLAYHLTRGYYQTQLHEFVEPADTAGCGIDRLGQWLAGFVFPATGSRDPETYYPLIDGALVPVGGDHIGPPPNLRQAVSKVNRHFQDTAAGAEIIVVGLDSFFENLHGALQAPMQVVQGIAGELRANSAAASYERAYLLPGVLSTRLYLKRANRLAERQLSRFCEPLFTMLSLCAGFEYPQRELLHVWKLLLKNQPHDSICGCSLDSVHRQMMSRYEGVMDALSALEMKARHLAAGGRQEDLISVCDPDFPADSLAVFNFSGAPSRGPVHLQWLEKPGESRQTAHNDIQIVSRRACDQLFSGWGTVPYYKDVQIVDGFVWSEPVPAFGCKSLKWSRRLPEQLPAQGVQAADEQALPPVTSSGRRLSNGLLDVFLERDGTLVVESRVEGKKSKIYRLGHILRDQGDGGDTYNFDPLDGDTPLNARVTAVKVAKAGPLVASLLVTYRLRIPERVVAGKEADEKAGKKALAALKAAGYPEKLSRCRAKLEHTVTTEITLKRGVPIVFFDTVWTNAASDHRLEVSFDTGATISSSYAENHFSLVRRLHNKKGRRLKLPVAQGEEAPPDRFPCQRFVIASGQVFLNEGLPEYAVEGRCLSITLLRAVSRLSRSRLRSRGGGAGPGIDVPEANCLGPCRAVYGWSPLPQGRAARSAVSEEMIAESYRIAEDFEGRLWAVLRRGELPEEMPSLIALDNPYVRPVALYISDVDGCVILRLLNVGSDPQIARLELGFPCQLARWCSLGEQDGPPVALEQKNQEPREGADKRGAGRFQSEDLVFKGNELRTLKLFCADDLVVPGIN